MPGLPANRAESMVMAVRPGEGHSVKINRTEIPLPNGRTQVEVSLHMDNAPVPERRYHAGVAAVGLDDHGAYVAFGEPKFGKGLRNLLIVHLTIEAAADFIKACLEFQPKLQAYMDGVGSKPASLIEINDEPPQTIALDANVIAVAHSGQEACLDCYHLSAWAKFAAQNKNARSVGIEPVVRIVTSTPILAAVIEGLQSILRPSSDNTEARP